MKKVRNAILFIGVLGLTITSLVLCSQQVMAAETIIRYAGSTPIGHHVTLGQEFFAKRIMERTNNRVKVEVYPAGQLFKDTDLTKALPTGALEMALSQAGIWAGRIPELLLPALPFFYEDVSHYHRTLDSEAGRIMNQIVEEKANVKVLWLADYESEEIMSKMPLRKLEDLKGKRIRCPGEMETELTRSLGAAATFLGIGEVYLALQKGTLEGLMTGPTTMWMRKYFEVTKHVTLGHFSYGTYVNMITRKAWDGLPKDVQAIFVEAGKEAQDWERKAAEKAQVEALENLKKQGVEIYTIPEQERNRWKEASKPCVDVFLKRVGEQKGRQLMELAEKVR